MAKPSIGIVVPAFNEATVITDSLGFLKKVIDKKHIFVVSDGSSDKTAVLAKKVVPNVLNLKKNRGKARALKALIDKYQLTKKYQYLFFFDADTRINQQFLTAVRKRLRTEKPALIVGTVGSGRNGLISAYRVYEYGFSHLFNKNAQNVMGAIVVAPGCASVYRADVIDRLDFTNKTLTEDLDLTMQIHHHKLGKIEYLAAATVATQDPATFSDYWNQVNRWNTGFWQNFFLHKLYLPNRKINLEVLVQMADVAMWLLISALAIARPLFFLKLYAISLGISSLIGALTAAYLKEYWAIPYAPLFGGFQIINLASFIYSFFRYLLVKPQRFSWQKVGRYALR